MTVDTNWPATLAGMVHAGGRLGVLTDLDGTISPFVDRPEQAQVAASVLDALAAIRTRVPVAGVISGRDIEDIRGRIPLPGLFISGNHGVAWRHGQVTHLAPAASRFAPRVEPLMRDLTTRLTLPGIELERKHFGVAIHYRRAAAAEATRAIILTVLADMESACDFAICEGARVVELLPDVHVDKGTIIRQVVTQFNLDAVVYFGDDITDANAFLALQYLREARGTYTVAVAALHPETAPAALAAADVTVPAVTGVAAILAELVGLIDSPPRQDAEVVWSPSSPTL